MTAHVYYLSLLASCYVIVGSLASIQLLFVVYSYFCSLRGDQVANQASKSTSDVRNRYEKSKRLKCMLRSNELAYHGACDGVVKAIYCSKSRSKEITDRIETVAYHRVRGTSWFHWASLVTGLEWTGLDWTGVDWTHPKICKMPFSV